MFVLLNDTKFFLRQKKVAFKIQFFYKLAIPKKNASFWVSVA